MISLNFKTLAQTPFFSLSVSWSGFGWVPLVCAYSAPYITKLKLSICVFKHLKDSGMCVCVCGSFVSDSATSWTVDSSVHGILQARILEWVTIPFSKGSSWPRNRIWVSCIAGRFLHHLSHQGSPGTWWMLINIYWTNTSVSSDSSSLGTDFLFCF